MKNVVLIASSVLIFILFNFFIYQKERLLKTGEIVYLQLVPVDPRSLMQGDYMSLRYAAEPRLPLGSRSSGLLVFAVNENRLGQFVRYYEGEALSPNERLIRYRPKEGVAKIVPDSFMFQEGHRAEYERAQYGVFKSDRGGDSILIGLADKDFAMIQGK